MKLSLSKKKWIDLKKAFRHIKVDMLHEHIKKYEVIKQMTENRENLAQGFMYTIHNTIQ